MPRQENQGDRTDSNDQVMERTKPSRVKACTLWCSLDVAVCRGVYVRGDKGRDLVWYAVELSQRNAGGA